MIDAGLPGRSDQVVFHCQLIRNRRYNRENSIGPINCSSNRRCIFKVDGPIIRV